MRIDHTVRHAVLATLLLLLGGGVLPPPAAACQCLPVPATVIFEGQVVGIRETTQGTAHSYFTWPVWDVAFAVQRSWKGPAAPERIVQTNRPFDDACGYPFELGQEYLVWAHEYPVGSAVTATTHCSRTQPMAEAREAITALERFGAYPVLFDLWFNQGASPRAVWQLLVVLSGVVVVLGGVLVYRLHPRRRREAE